MPTLKEQLIRLGSTNPELQVHIKPVLDALTKQASPSLPPKLHKILETIEDDINYRGPQSISMDLTAAGLSYFHARRRAKLKVQNDVPLNADLVLVRGTKDWPSLGIYEDLPATHEYVLKTLGGKVVATGTLSDLENYIQKKGFMRVKKASGFDAWMRKVDQQIQRLSGVSYMDLPDAPYHSWYDQGMRPNTAARKALKSAGF